MKKIKFLGAALLAASLIFAGCANGSDDDVDSTPDTEKVVDEKGGAGSEENGGSESGSGEEAGGEENSGEDQNSGSGESSGSGDSSSSGSGDSGSSSGGESSGSGDSEDAGDGDSGDEDEDTNEYTAPAIADYFKYYLVSSPAQASNKALGNWGDGTESEPNGDGTYTVNASGSMWGGNPGVCMPLSGLEEGIFSKYEYIVFTVDIEEFEIENGDGNKGVNVKLAKNGTNIGNQQSVVSNYVANGNVRTYYAPMSLFGTEVPPVANEMAIIIGGTGTVQLNEVYFAAEEDPSNKPITGITITPATASLEKNGTQQFTVKDSNLVNRTSEVTYELSGDAAVGSTISEDGLLTVGTTAGSLTVTASYSVEGSDEPFTAEAAVTVLGELENLITELTDIPFACYGPNWAWQLHTDNSIGDIEDFITKTNDSVTYHIPEATNLQWQAQIKVVTDADIATGDSWILTVDVEGINCANGTLQIGSVQAATALKEVSFNAIAEGSTITVTGTATTSIENIALHFDFAPGSTDETGDVKLTNFKFSKTN